MANKPAFLFKQAGAMPYRWNDGHVEVILVTSRSSGGWIFPKGVIDPGETPESTAVKEAFEEAGIVGVVTGGPLGRYEQEKWGGVAKVDVYPVLVIEVMENWSEQATRQRQSVSLEDAMKMVSPLLVPILISFAVGLKNDPIRPT